MSESALNDNLKKIICVLYKWKKPIYTVDAFFKIISDVYSRVLKIVHYDIFSKNGGYSVDGVYRKFEHEISFLELVCFFWFFSFKMYGYVK